MELEERWGLTRAFSLDKESEFFAAVEGILADPVAAAERHRHGRERLLEWCDDPLDDLVRWTRELAADR